MDDIKKIKLDEPTYRELLALCKVNIRQLLTIGIVNSDESIEKHFGGEKELLEVMQGYVNLAENLYHLFETEMGIK